MSIGGRKARRQRGQRCAEKLLRAIGTSDRTCKFSKRADSEGNRQSRNFTANDARVHPLRFRDAAIDPISRIRTALKRMVESRERTARSTMPQLPQRSLIASTFQSICALSAPSSFVSFRCCDEDDSRSAHMAGRATQEREEVKVLARSGRKAAVRER
jgi:hypothetical protein